MAGSPNVLSLNPKLGSFAFLLVCYFLACILYCSSKLFFIVFYGHMKGESCILISHLGFCDRKTDNIGFWSSLNFILNQLFLHKEEVKSGNSYPK